MKYKLVFAPAGAGKSYQAEHGNCYDGDVIISVTCGWPRDDSYPGKLHNGQWWKEAKTVDLIQAAHAAVIGSWIMGPNRPYASVPGWENFLYVENMKGPVAFNTGIDIFCQNSIINALVAKKEVGVWLPGYDIEKKDSTQTVRLLLEHMTAREKMKDNKNIFNESELKGMILGMLSGAEKHGLDIITTIDLSEEAPKPVEVKDLAKGKEPTRDQGPVTEDEKPLKDVRLTPKVKEDEDGPGGFGKQVSEYFKTN